MDEIMSELWNFTTVQARMIQQESFITRQANHVPSLLRQSRDAVMLRLTSNNNQETLVTPLVDRLRLQADAMNHGGKFPESIAKNILKTSFSGGSNIDQYCLELVSFYQYFRTV